MMNWANDYVGIPFAEKGRTREGGLDCFGLVKLVLFEQYDIRIREADGYKDSRDINCICTIFDASVKRDWLEVLPPSKAKPGDVVVFKMKSPHLGIVVGEGLFLHVMEGRNTCIENFRASMWSGRLIGVYRCKP